MRNAGWDHEAFKGYVVTAASNVPGLNSQADIARYIGVGPSLLSKWFRGEEVPSLDSLTKVLKLPGTALDALLTLTGRKKGEPVAMPTSLRAVHPLARELDDMLDEASPIAVADKEVLVTLVDRIVDPYRRTMRRRRPA